MRCASVARGLSDFQIVVQPLELEGVANVRSRPEKVPLSVAYVGLADLLAQVAEFDGALRDLDLAADADPLNSEIGVARGSILTQAGRWEEAKRALQGVLAKNPNEEAAVSALGIVAWQGERERLSVGHPISGTGACAAIVRPCESSIHENLGAIYCGMGRCAEGILHFEQALHSNSRETPLLRQSGDCITDNRTLRGSERAVPASAPNCTGIRTRSVRTRET
jgi:tetratricopeptide (TPR) repeat protein